MATTVLPTWAPSDSIYNTANMHEKCGAKSRSRPKPDKFESTADGSGIITNNVHEFNNHW